MTTLGKLAEMIVRWYVLAIVLYAVQWILCGSNPYNMIINMTAALSGLVMVIIIIEILRRKVKFSDWCASNSQRLVSLCTFYKPA